MDGNMRQVYQGRFPTLGAELWLPPAYDNAVIGMAERSDELVPVYLYASLLNSRVQPNVGDRFRSVTQALEEAPEVAVLHKPAVKDFWRRVASKEFVAWQLLTPAIRGVMSRGISKPHAVVYARSVVLDHLARAVVDSDLEGPSPEEVAAEDYKTKLLACQAGEATPWYFFT